MLTRTDSLLMGLTLLLAAVISGCRNDGSTVNKPQQPAKPKTASQPAAKPEAAVAPPPVQPKQPAIMDATTLPAGHPLVIAGIVLMPPAGWSAEPPTSGMRKAQYRLPGETGDAELVIFYFGQNGAGPRDANIQRWVGQFKNGQDPAKPAEYTTETSEHNGLVHTIVKVTGTFAPRSMSGSGGPQEPKAASAMYGVILEGGSEGPLYLKAVGPTETITSQMAALVRFHEKATKSP